jgi:DNA-binding IclR family transcriptional regulator
MASQIASSLDKALGLLFAFADPDLGARVLTVSALAERSGMDKAQVSRVLATFAKYGVVERLDHRRGYQLGWSVLSLASAALLAQTYSTVYPLLSQLSIDVRESVHFSVRDGASAVTVGAFEPDRRLAVRLRTGRAFPLLGSAVGHALLARSSDAEVASIVGTLDRKNTVLLRHRDAGRDQGVYFALGTLNRDDVRVNGVLHTLGNRDGLLADT